MVENDDSGDSVIVPSSNNGVGRHSYHHQPPDPNIRLIWQDAIDLGEIRNVQDQSDFRSLRIQLGIDRIPSETLSRYHLKGHMDSYEQPAICYPRYFGPSGRTRTPDYASYLSGARCYIITKKERPIELIREERIKEIKRAIHEEAVRVRNPGFRCMNDVREDVKNEIIQSKTKMAGFAQWKRFDVLNHYLKGFRPSELTVLTGGTGTGKTTFVCEYSLDLYAQGVRTLFCSFEIPEEKILKWMLVQYAAPTHLRSLSRTRTYHNGVRLPLHRVENHPSVEMWLDRFERTKGDLIVMKTDEFRDKTVTEISNAIREQVIAGGIQHVVIDNLQFLVNLATLHNDKTSAIERYHQQDRFVGLLRSLATDYRIHITLVVHPRKVEGEEIDIHHIGGSSRVIQEADNVLAIQRHRDEVDKRKFRKFLYILKNRYGMRRIESDQIEMVFQPSTYTHTLIDYAQAK
uniref:SF4 helicase domain-containing protein n=1 Tax=Panagrolaimus sp. PS1159 TaxID=55785 RepID=A0AC35G5H2_9BILA